MKDTMTNLLGCVAVYGLIYATSHSELISNIFMYCVYAAVSTYAILAIYELGRLFFRELK